MSAMPPPVLPRPYEEPDLTDDDWCELPIIDWETTSLTPSQEGLSLARLAHLVNGEPPEGDGQVDGRVVVHHGCAYVHDGHHRWVIALLTNRRVFRASTVWLLDGFCACGTYTGIERNALGHWVCKRCGKFVVLSAEGT